MWLLFCGPSLVGMAIKAVDENYAAREEYQSGALLRSTLMVPCLLDNGVLALIHLCNG